MEMEQGAFSSPKPHQMHLNSEAKSPDIISSWLNMDDIYNPKSPGELHDMHMLDDQLFHFAQTDFEIEPASLNPPQDDYEDSFQLDFSSFQSDFSAAVGPMAPMVAEEAAPIEREYERECFFNQDLCTVAIDESQESLFDHLLTSTWTPTWTNSPETNQEMSSEMASAAGMQNQEDGEEEEQIEDVPKRGTLNCKNLVSERNRRKRLSQQLLALRALVPNITKMDKRSVLIDALAYLKGIHEETARIRKELNEISSSPSSSSSFSCCSRFNYYSMNPFLENTCDGVHPFAALPAVKSSSKQKAQIVEIDIEKIEDRRFVVKMMCRGGAGVGGVVLSVIESLGFEITYTVLEQLKPMQISTTIFVRVRKQGRMTEEKLKDCITSTALRSGLMFQNP